MIPTILIVLLLFSYAAFVIVRKVRRIKKGQFCDCGCGGCKRKGCSQVDKCQDTRYTEK